MTTAICSSTRKKSRMLLAPCSAKLSAQSPPCSRKALPAATRQEEVCPGPNPAERLRQVARLTCEHQWRKGGKLRLDIGQCLRIRIIGDLQHLLGAPAVGCPTLGHDVNS